MVDSCESLRVAIGWLLLFLVLASIPATLLAQDDSGTGPSADKAGLRLPPRHDASGAHSTTHSKKSSSNSGLWTTLFLLATIVGCLLGCAYLLRPYLGASKGLSIDALELLGRRMIDQKVAIHLVRCGSRVLVLSVCPDGARTLSEITDPDEVERLIAACNSSAEGRPRSGIRIPGLGGEEISKGHLGQAIHSKHGPHIAGKDSSSLSSEGNRRV